MSHGFVSVRSRRDPPPDENLDSGNNEDEQNGPRPFIVTRTGFGSDGIDAVRQNGQNGRRADSPTRNTNASAAPFNTRGGHAFTAIVLGEPSGEEARRDPGCRYVVMVLCPEIDHRVDSTEEDKPKLAKIPHEAFRLDVKPGTQSNNPEIKRLRRKLEEPLHFGDDITFYAENYDRSTEYIKKFDRGMKNCPRFERRAGDQLLLQGVMDEPHNYRVWCAFPLFSFVDLPPPNPENGMKSPVSRMLPNVAVFFWLRVWESDRKLRYQFVDFDRVEQDNQYIVDNTPWNRLKCAAHFDSDDSDDDSHLLAEEVRNNMDPFRDNLMKGKQCLCTSPRTLLCVEQPKNVKKGTQPPDYTTWNIMVPLIKVDQELRTGQHFKCDLFYHSSQDCYLAFQTVRLDSVPVYNSTYVPHIMKHGIEIRVKEKVDFPGTYESIEFGQITFVDDPRRLLSMLQFAYELRRKPVKVMVFDDGPSKFGRFRILDIDEEISVKLKAFVQSNDMKLLSSRVTGVVVNKEGTVVFAGKRPNLIFRFSTEKLKDWRNLGPGTKINYTAVFSGQDGVFDISSWSESDAKPLPTARRNDGSVWFQTQCTWVRGEFSRVVVSEDFGPIDDPDNLQHKFEPNKKYTLWVKQADLDPETDLPKQRTAFYLVCSKKHPPVDTSPTKQVFVSKVTDMSERIAPLLNVTQHSSRFSIPADIEASPSSRFSTPSVRESAVTSASSRTVSRFAAPADAPSTASSRFAVPESVSSGSRPSSRISVHSQAEESAKRIPPPASSNYSGPLTSQLRGLKLAPPSQDDVKKIEEAVQAIVKGVCCPGTKNLVCPPGCSAQSLIRKALKNAEMKATLSRNHSDIYDHILDILTS